MSDHLLALRKDRQKVASDTEGLVFVRSAFDVGAFDDTVWLEGFWVPCVGFDKCP